MKIPTTPKEYMYISIYIYIDIIINNNSNNKNYFLPTGGDLHPPKYSSPVSAPAPIHI